MGRAPDTLPVTRDLEVWFIDLAASLEYLEAVECSVPRLAADQRARFNEMAVRDQDAARFWRAGHIAVRLSIERWAGEAHRGIPFELEAGGRPRLPRDARRTAPDLHFSFSHTGAIAMCALTRRGPIGIDVEMERAPLITAERRQRIEHAALLLAPGRPLPDAADARLLQAWVRLEAIAKATGLGIGRILTEAGVVGAAGSPSRQTGERDGETYDFEVRDLTVRAGCFAAVAAGFSLPDAAARDFPRHASDLGDFLRRADLEA